MVDDSVLRKKTIMSSVTLSRNERKKVGKVSFSSPFLFSATFFERFKILVLNNTEDAEAAAFGACPESFYFSLRILPFVVSKQERQASSLRKKREKTLKVEPIFAAEANVGNGENESEKKFLFPPPLVFNSMEKNQSRIIHYFHPNFQSSRGKGKLYFFLPCFSFIHQHSAGSNFSLFFPALFETRTAFYFNFSLNSKLQILLCYVDISKCFRFNEIYKA